MPLLCFVLDTSQSMNQKTVQGQRLIDHAKTAIENFINKVRDKKNMEKQIEFISIEQQKNKTNSSSHTALAMCALHPIFFARQWVRERSICCF